MILVDQDETNGNVDKTRQLAETLRGLGTALRDADQRIEGSLLKTRILSPRQGFNWCPVRKEDVGNMERSLESLFDYRTLANQERHRPLADLMDCLYLREEREQSLEKGYRARPNIGAAAMMWNSLQRETSIWSGLTDIVSTSLGGNEARVFLVGSLFGGTGAAGFPTLARDVRNEMPIGKSSSIGGALLLPYFRFPPPSNDPEQSDLEIKSGAAPTSDNFLRESEAALRYYAGWLDEEKVLDSLYLIGWDPLFRLGHNADGSKSQLNPPMIPELYAALGAMRFFRHGAADEHPVLVTGRKAGSNLTWSDLPTLGVEGMPDVGEVKERLGQLIRYAVSFNYLYGPALQPEMVKRVAGERWFKTFFDRASASDERLRASESDMRNYCRMAMDWIAGIQWSHGDSLEINLVDPTVFAEHHESDTRRLHKPRANLSKHERASFSTLVHDASPVSLESIFRKISSRAKGELGFTAFCTALHESCRSDSLNTSEGSWTKN